MKKLCFLLTFAAILISGNVLAFDNESTHRDLTEAAVEKSNLNYYVTEHLNLANGIDTSINDKKIMKWLKDGSILEDVPQCRASNHFHNPLKPWTESYMSDQPWFIDWWCSASEYPPGDIKSAIHWATGYTEPAPDGAKVETENEWDWDHAREHYYIYLTGKDFQGNSVAATKDQREEYFAKCFRSLGQLLHLLQDMAVPAHVRNDFRSHLDWVGITPEAVFHPTKWFGDKFEYFVAKHDEWITGSSGGDLADRTLTKFWDTDNYNGQNPSISLDSQLIGLAEYANINFASKNTIFAEDFLADSDPSNDVYYHPYPRKSSTDVAAVLSGNKHPETVIGEDGNIDLRVYVAKTSDGETIAHFTTPTYFTNEITAVPGYDAGTFYESLVIDRECARDYADKLLPRAVGYSAELLDYFFRGGLEVEYNDEGFKVTNRSQEALDNGSFELYYDNADGDRKDISILSGAAVTILAPDDSQTIAFDTPSDLGEDGSYVLVYEGGLGNETDAIVGKVIPQEEEFYIRLAFNSHPPTQGLKQIRIYYEDNEGDEAFTTEYCDSSGLIGPFTKTWNTGPADPSKISNPAYVALHYQSSDPIRILHALWYEVEEAEADYSVGIGLETFRYENGGDQQYLKVSSDNPTLHVKRVEFKRESTNIFSFPKTVENIAGADYPVYNVNISGLYLIANDLNYFKQWAESEEGYNCEGCGLVLCSGDTDAYYQARIDFQHPSDYDYYDGYCWECERPDVNIMACFWGNHNIASVTPLSDRTIFILSDQHGNNPSYESVAIVEGMFIESYQILEADGGEVICEMSMTHERDFSKETYTMQLTPASRF
ncbi:MAG: hypothetical protein ABIF87_03185 [Pseudomonadota bacterium]